MASTMTFPTTSSIGVGRQPKRPTSSRNGEKPAIWIPMLQSTSKGKDLVEKQLIVLGGSPDQQREFLEQLNPQQDTVRSRFNQSRRPRQAPISNKYMLGYTYHDVLDADHEDVLARLNVYMLSNPSGMFAPLLKPLLTAKSVKDTLITILLDWSEPWKWARQLRQWIRLLRKVILTLDNETKIEMEQNMNAWKQKKTGPDAHRQTDDQKSALSVPSQGPGEWDDGLGVPLSVVCIQSENVEKLEREQGWEEDHFDFLLQWIRTVLLKHGASLCYVASFDSNDVRTLLHSSLNIQSLLRRDIAKHNVIDRDKILVPPNWDSHGKIRILRDAFDADTIAEKWSTEIDAQPDQSLDYKSSDRDLNSAVALYESSIPKQPDNQTASKQPSAITVTVPTLQEFLQEQKVVLDKLEEKESTKPNLKDFYGISAAEPESMSKLNYLKANSEGTGSYQINVNGIDVDAEAATRRLREREEERKTSKRESTPSGERKSRATDNSTEQYKNFFADLISKKGAGRGSTSTSGVASPRRESPNPQRRVTDYTDDNR